MNAVIRAHNLIDLLQDLVSVLERENELLQSPRSSELEPVVKEKQALFKLYEDQMTAVAAEGDFGAKLPDELRERLKALAMEFDTVMKLNRRRLELLTKSSQMIVDRIIDAARSAAGQVPRYERSGGVKHGSHAAPIAMNQEI